MFCRVRLQQTGRERVIACFETMSVQRDSRPWSLFSASFGRFSSRVALPLAMAAQSSGADGYGDALAGWLVDLDMSAAEGGHVMSHSAPQALAMQPGRTRDLAGSAIDPSWFDLAAAYGGEDAAMAAKDGSEGEDLFGDELAPEEATGGDVMGEDAGHLVVFGAGAEQAIVPMGGLGGGGFADPDTVALQYVSVAEEGDVLADALDRCLRHEGRVDSSVKDVMSSLFRLGRAKGVKNLADDADVGCKKFRRVQTLVCNTLGLAERFLRKSFESVVLSQDGLVKHAYFEFSTFDETPMKVREKHFGAFFDAEGQVQEVAAHNQRELDIARPVAGQPASSAVVVAKVLQSRQAWSMLVSTPSGKMLIFRSTIGNWIQVVDRNTGECLHQALLDTASPSPSSDQYDFRCRVVSTDAHGANIRAEQEIVRQRAGWDLLHVHCEVHKVATCFKQCFALASPHCTGMLHLSLALRSGSGAYRLFRQTLRRVLSSKLRFIHAVPASDSAREFRLSSISLFLLGKENAGRRAVLDCLAPGDWRKRDAVECVVSGPLADDASARERLRTESVNNLAWALLPRQPAVYNASRWGGADLAIQSLGLLHSFHGVLEDTFAEWHKLMSDPKRKAEAQPRLQPLEDVGPLQEAPDLGSILGGGPTHGAQDNERHRKVAKAFIDSQSSFRLPLLGIVIRPLSSLLRACMRLGGEKWEAEQRARVARHSAEGGRVEREYRIIVAAECVLEARFFEKLRAAHDETEWSAVHPSERTESMQAMAFRMLSRAGAAVYQQLKMPHSLMPYKLFRLIKNPDTAQDILSTPECLRDPFGASFLEKYGAELRSEVTLAKLTLLADMVKLDTASVEVGHSRFRRALLVASTTWRQLVDNASADWVTQDWLLRRGTAARLCGLRPWDEKDEPGPDKTDDAQAPEQPPPEVKAKPRRDGRQVSGGGGAYRAFLRETQLPMFSSETAETYRKATKDEKERYESQGRLMTEGHRARKDLGIAPQSRGRAGERLLQRRALEQAIADCPTDVSDSGALALEVAPGPGDNSSEALRAARRDKRVQAAAAKKADQEITHALAQFDNECREKDLAALFTSGFRCRLNPSDFMRIASPSVSTMFEFCPDALALSTKVLGRALADKRFDGFLHFLEHDWRRKHATIMHDSSPAIVAPTVTPSACHRAGVCVCARIQVKRFASRLSMFVKKACPPGTSNRKVLDSASVVLRLRVSGDAVVDNDRFLHIALVIWSPFVFVVQEMKKLGEDERFITLQATRAPNICEKMAQKEVGMSDSVMGRQGAAPRPHSKAHLCALSVVLRSQTMSDTIRTPSAQWPTFEPFTHRLTPLRSTCRSDSSCFHQRCRVVASGRMPGHERPDRGGQLCATLPCSSEVSHQRPLQGKPRTRPNRTRKIQR